MITPESKIPHTPVESHRSHEISSEERILAETELLQFLASHGPADMLDLFVTARQQGCFKGLTNAQVTGVVIHMIDFDFLRYTTSRRITFTQKTAPVDKTFNIDLDSNK